MNNYTLSVELDSDTNEYILTFPPELLNKLNWVEGDTLVWKINDDGTITLNKEEIK